MADWKHMQVRMSYNPIHWSAVERFDGKLCDSRVCMDVMRA